jgi:hypothetical protein
LHLSGSSNRRLATLRASPPESDRYVHEIKFDG